RRPSRRGADGHEHRSCERAGDRGVARGRGRRRDLPRHAHDGGAERRPRLSAVRVRGRHHRRPGLVLGHVGRRRDPGHGTGDRVPHRSGLGHPGRSRRVLSRPARPPPRALSANSRVNPAMTTPATRRGGAAGSTVSSREHPPRVRRSTRASRIGGWAAVAIAARLASLPLWADSSAMRLMVEALWLVVAEVWNLVAGYGGLVSVGQQAYVGLGGYALVTLADFAGLNPFLCIPLGGVVAALVALPVSRIVFRLEGGYFAIGTWVVAEVLRLAVANTSALGGGSGQSLISMRAYPKAMREAPTYWLGVALPLTAIGLMYLVLRSRFGLGLSAMRDSEVAAESQGVDVAAVKLRVYVAAAFGAGAAGALYFLMNLRI